MTVMAGSMTADRQVLEQSLRVYILKHSPGRKKNRTWHGPLKPQTNSQWHTFILSKQYNWESNVQIYEPTGTIIKTTEDCNQRLSQINPLLPWVAFVFSSQQQETNLRQGHKSPVGSTMSQTCHRTLDPQRPPNKGRASWLAASRFKCGLGSPWSVHIIFCSYFSRAEKRVQTSPRQRR